MKKIIKNAEIRSRVVWGKAGNKVYSSEGKVIAEVNDAVISNLQNQITDAKSSSTTLLSVASEFELYDANTPIVLNRFGQAISITGIVKPKNTITGGIDRHTICTLPSGLAPICEIHSVAQGSGNAQWTLSITTAGLVRFSRYHNTASAANTYNDADNTQWLPFHAMWIIT